MTRAARPGATHQPERSLLATCVRLSLLAPLLLTMTIAAREAAATVRVEGGSILISGEIKRSDVGSLDVALKKADSKLPLIFLDSPGGEVLAAMDMGRMIRSKKAMTHVVAPASCSSACVFLLAAGVSRLVWNAKVGIHRPMFPPKLFAALNADDAMLRYNALIEQARTYLKGMGMPEALFNEMLKVSSGDIRWLTEEELNLYGLEGVDPAWAEWVRAKGIQRFGLKEIERSERSQKCIAETGDREGCARALGPPFPYQMLDALPPGFEPIR